MFHIKVCSRRPFGLMIVLVSLLPPPLFLCQLLVLTVPLLVIYPLLKHLLRSLAMHRILLLLIRQLMLKVPMEPPCCPSSRTAAVLPRTSAKIRPSSPGYGSPLGIAGA
jgi:hypothetical protein